MRFLGTVSLFLFLAACAPSAPNPVVQDLEMLGLKMAAVTSHLVTIESAYKRKDIVKAPDAGDKNTTVTISTKYVEPFQGCARYNTAYRYVRTGFFSSERNYDFIFKVCEQDQELYNIELLHPDIPGITGVKDVVDIRRTALYVKQDQ